MALRRNSILASLMAVAACLSTSALADDSTITDREDDHRSEYLDDNYIYDYMGHQDSITIGLGDAPTSNIVIQHPTPWPSYINNTTIKTSAGQGVSALDSMMQRYMNQSTSTSAEATDAGVTGGSTSGLVGSSGAN